ncbi:HIR complex subunit [Malassezia pachydermatis]|uniref:Protein HIR n=1 Tax=Malassezia pachydermatis TaxID=77020 RepID=A0A0M8MSR6_9BASI|nr:transcription corepressor [Malassezia pachydermatis]KOS12891.1 transcription corepressor [Malassezia pachydermatis]
MVRITVPDWLVHRADERAKRSTIYSVDVHPDGTRLATGGLDTKIRVWSTAPVLDDTSSERRLLSTLARHTGAVLSVRWSHSGKYLASGSDDTVALVWELDTTGTSSGLAFGTSETNVEQWRPHRRLPGHDSDVTDVAWSDSDTYLATVGLDSLVIVWSGDTFERVRTIRGHHGFVKGVAFDPVDQFLATSSDDRTLKVWRTSDWGLEASISDPFHGAPSTTFFHRPSWSPDGAHLLAANAMNGPVFVASVIPRYAWTSDIALVGHENAVTVAACSPRLFQGAKGPVTVVALGSQDQSVSVWITGTSRPLMVARSLFERHVMDLVWSADGYSLYACSSDGTVAVITFDETELGHALPEATLLDARAAYGYVAPSKPRRPPMPLPTTTARAPAVLMPASQDRLQQHISRNADGKRRIRPTLMQTTAAMSTPSPFLAAAAATTTATSPTQPQPQPQPQPRRPPVYTISHGTELSAPPPLARLPAYDPYARTLGGEHPVRALARGVPMDVEIDNDVSRWPMPVQSTLQCTLEAAHIDVHNATTYADVIYVAADRIQWADFVASPVVSIAASRQVVAVSLADGTMHWYSSRGSRQQSLYVEPCGHVAVHEAIVVALTFRGELRRWDTTTGTELGHAVRVPRDEVASLSVHTNGVPVVVLKQREEVWAYDVQHGALVCVGQGAIARYSEAWDRRRGRSARHEAPVRYYEAELHDILTTADIEHGLPAQRIVAATLRHWEMRMRAACVLESADEYREALLALAQRLAQEGIRNQAEDLLQSLLGPVYYEPRTPSWQPTVLGWDKRTLLASVLDVMREGPLASLASSYTGLLRALTT